MLGVVVRVWTWWTGPRELDPIIAMAWSLSLWQVIAWPCMFFSGVWMLSDHYATGILGAGLLAGVFYGAWSIRAEAASISGLGWFTLGGIAVVATLSGVLLLISSAIPM